MNKLIVVQYPKMNTKGSISSAVTSIKTSTRHNCADKYCPRKRTVSVLDGEAYWITLHTWQSLDEGKTEYHMQLVSMNIRLGQKSH